MRAYKIYIDENLPPQLAQGLNILAQQQNKKNKVDLEVLSIQECFGRGASDEEWIPKVGSEHGIVITQDFRIQTQKHQKELYQKHGVGIFFFTSPSKTGYSYWEMVKQLINRWEEVTQIVTKNKTPFAYKCSAKSKFEKLTY